MHTARILQDLSIGSRLVLLARTVAAILGMQILLSPASEAQAAALCPDDVPAEVEIPAHTGTNPRFSTGSAHATLTAASAPPFFCIVDGSITIDDAPEATAIRFNLLLPAEASFSGRLFFLGRGGLSGYLGLEGVAAAAAVSKGFAVVNTDTGHQGRRTDGTWASGAPEERKNYHFRANHLVAVAAKAIVDDYYTPSVSGDLPSFAYFAGCSNGGREGLIEAQEFPADFDGILAGGPAIGRTEQALSSTIPGTQAQWQDGFLSPVESPLFGSLFGAPLQANNVFPAPSRIFLGPSPTSLVGVLPGKLETLADTVRDVCDGSDGIRDGILDNPRTCPPDAVLDALPRCADDSVCFTEREIAYLRDGYTSPFPLLPGSEDTPFRGWDSLLGMDTDVPDGPFVPLGLRDPVSGERPPTRGPVEVCPTLFPTSFCAGPDGLPNLIPGVPGGDGTLSTLESVLRYFVFETDPTLPVSLAEQLDFTLDFDLANKRDVELLRSRMIDGEGLNPDLNEFRDRGGKLIVHMGWQDWVVGPMATVNYYEDVARTTRGNARDFARLFMIPGMHHCILPGLDPGPVPDEVDMFEALISWTESGIPPDSFPAKTVAVPFPFTRDTITRPICPYPEVARQIDSSGSQTDAANFHCVNVPFPVEVDIKPGNDRNCINSKASGVIPMGILSTSYFDAAQIDPSTVALDGQPVRVRPNGRPKARMKDLDRDGRDDLLVQIDVVPGTYDVNDHHGTATAQTSS